MKNAPTPLPRKLGVTGDVVFTVLHEPPGFAGLLGDTGDAVWQHNLMAPLDVILSFHTRLAEVEREWPRLVAPLQPAGAAWIAWPKQTSSITTDITGDALRARILPSGWVDDKVCAIDDTWSALRFVLRVSRRGSAARAGR